MGFFTVDQKRSKLRPDGKVYSCISCGLYKEAEHPKMPVSGGGKKNILVIGTSPDQYEDENNEHWGNKYGNTLANIFSDNDIDFYEDCYHVHAVRCRINQKRPPTDYEIACCRINLTKEIERLKPNLIIPVGTVALDALISHRWKKGLGGIEKWRGWAIPDRDLNAWVCPIYHPKWVSQYQKERYNVSDLVWKQDIELALSRHDTPLPEWEDEKQFIEYVVKEDVEDVLYSIEKEYEGGIAYFDYETTGLKPHGRGHRIVCTAIAVASNKCYSFMGPNTHKTKQALAYLLATPKIAKAAANMKFEATWTKERLNTSVYPFVWDTMQAAHVLDNRKGITGLKFQTYVEMGVIDYDSHLSPYLKGTDPKNANSLNRIFEFIETYGEKDVLTYCGLDALYEYKLGAIQMARLNTTMEQEYKRVLNGIKGY